jgi:hypothetical protein
MAVNDFKRQDDGWYECLTCHFLTAHEVKIQAHMVKSHQHKEYPAPPILAEKWRKVNKRTKGK